MALLILAALFVTAALGCIAMGISAALIFKSVRTGIATRRERMALRTAARTESAPAGNVLRHA